MHVCVCLIIAIIEVGSDSAEKSTLVRDHHTRTVYYTKGIVDNLESIRDNLNGALTGLGSVVSGWLTHTRLFSKREIVKCTPYRRGRSPIKEHTVVDLRFAIRIQRERKSY